MPLYESPNLHLHAWSRAPAYSVGCQDIHTTSQNLSRRTNAQISAWLNEALFLFFYSLYTVNIGILLSYKTKCLNGITGTYLSSFLELLFKTMHKRMSAWLNVRVVRSCFFFLIWMGQSSMNLSRALDAQTCWYISFHYIREYLNDLSCTKRRIAPPSKCIPASLLILIEFSFETNHGPIRSTLRLCRFAIKYSRDNNFYRVVVEYNYESSYEQVWAVH